MVWFTYGVGVPMAEARFTILVVDDEDDILEMIEIGLGSSNYEMLLANGGERAIKLFEHHRADLVICDIKMPGMNGLATISRLREHDPDVPVIVLTGYAAPQVLEQCVELGGVDLLRKPFAFQDLSEAVNAALRRSRRASSQLPQG